MKNSWFRKGILFLIPILFFIACEDDPTSIGSNLIPDSDKLEFVEISSTEVDIDKSNSSYLGEVLPHSGADRVLLGKFDNITYTTLVRVTLNTLADSIKDDVQKNNLTVNEARFTLNYNYSVGDKNSEFSIVGKEITENWNYSDFLYDSLAALQTIDKNLITPISGDHTDSTFVYNLDNDIALQWINARVDPNNYDYYGLLLEPDDNNNLVIGIYENLGFQVEIEVADEKGNIDTLRGSAFWDTHVVNGEIPNYENDELVLQSGLQVRSNLYFDFLDTKMLPKIASINEAKLELNLNTDNSSEDSVAVLIGLFEDIEKDSVVTTVGSVLRRNGNILSGNITSLVQYAVNNDKNDGFRLVFADEHYGATKYILKGHEAEEALRPKLTIYYSKQR